MRHARPLVMLGISALLGLAAVALAAQWLQVQEKNDTLAVVVAKQDLPMGTRLQAHMLEVVRWPVAAPIEAPLQSTQQALDRVVNVQVLRGEPLLHHKLAAAGEIGGLSAVLREGRRAVTVKVNEIMGVAGFALPGNYVDVMVNTPDGQDQPVSKIVLERIQVLAAAQDVASTENKPRVVNAVTLEVSPEQAEKIDLARSVGTLSLVLRSQVDSGTVQTQGARKTDLLPAPQAVAPGHRPQRRPGASGPLAFAQGRPSAEARTEVIRGLQRSHE